MKSVVKGSMNVNYSLNTRVEGVKVMKATSHSASTRRAMDVEWADVESGIKSDIEWTNATRTQAYPLRCKEIGQCEGRLKTAVGRGRRVAGCESTCRKGAARQIHEKRQTG